MSENANTPVGAGVQFSSKQVNGSTGETSGNRTLVDAALEYAARGWYVFPVQVPIAGDKNAGDKKSGKAPAGRLVPNGKDDATTDPATIKEWWSHGHWNIGIACEPSGLVVLDCDTANGKQGETSLRQIADQLAETLTAETGSGGYHLVYSRPEGLKPPQLIGFEPGLDLIGKGYIVAPPSAHYSGGSYSWIDERAIAPLPDVLVHAVLVHAVKAKPEPRAAEAGKVGEGGRNSYLVSVGGTLRERGLGQDAIDAALVAINQAECDPPLDEDEVHRIAASVARYEPGLDLKTTGKLVGALTRKSKPEPAPSTLVSDLLARDIPPLRNYSTGFASLDARLGGGISSRSLTVVVARTGAGKSGFAIGTGIEQALKGIPFLYISTELDADEAGCRVAAVRLGISHADILFGRVPRQRARDAVAGLPIHIIGQESMARGATGLDVIKNVIADITAKYGKAPVVCVDFIQQLVDDDPNCARMGVSSVANALRAMSQQYDCAILGISSTSRGNYRPPKDGADDPISYLGAAKESGDVEFAAANVLFLDVAAEPVGLHYMARIVVAKARRGRAGFVGAQFHGPSGRWTEHAGALAELSGVTRKKQKTELAREKVLKAITDYPTLAWAKQRDKSGVDTTLAKEIRDDLLDQGIVEVVSIKSKDSLGRPCTKHVYRLATAKVEAEPPPSKPDAAVTAVADWAVVQ